MLISSRLFSLKKIFSYMTKNQKTSILTLLKALTSFPVITTSASIKIALKIFACMSYSNSNDKRSFSVLEGIKI